MMDRNIMSENNPAWKIYIGCGDSLGGRVLRRQVAREGSFYELWEPLAELHREGEKRGLLLPFLEIGEGNQEKHLPRVALCLQKARDFDRVVLLLREPLPEVLALMHRHQEQGLQVTAVCAGKGELYGSEGPEEAAGPVEELLDALRERMASASPRKRLMLSYGEKEKLPLTYAGDLASAALFVLRQDNGLMPLLVEGRAFAYGEIVRAVAQGAGFQGKLQFGRARSKRAKADNSAFRVMQGHALYSPAVVLPYLMKARSRGGGLRLSACVIMRDNEEDIGRCLKSLSAVDEIIVVDTGSADKSVEIAKKYTDKVFYFNWIDDFAAAKNYALSKATGDWIVFPDSDEFFTEKTAPNLHRIAEDYEGPWARPVSLSVRHANVDLLMNPMGQEGAVIRFWQAGLNYVGAVHEHLEYQGGKDSYMVINVPREMVLMLHTGYAPERMGAKTQRNMEILDREWQAGKEIPLYHYYKARFFFAAGNWQEAREEALKQYHSGGQPGAMQAETYRIWYRASLQLGDKEAMEEARAAMEKDMPLLPDAWALKGASLWNEGREEEAVPFLTRALELSARFLADSPREIDQVGMDMPAIAREVADYYEKRGEMEQATKIRNILTRDR